MKAETNKPDISILVRSGHFYFGWTMLAIVLDTSRIKVLKE
jgi:hypothetical protein